MQADLFSPESMAAVVAIPPAPALVPHHDWPFPGMTPEDSARTGWVNSSEYADVLAAIVHSQGDAQLTAAQVLALVPADWRDLLGRFAHGCLSSTQGTQRGVDVRYVNHDGSSGFHFTFQAAA